MKRGAGGRRGGKGRQLSYASKVKFDDNLLDGKAHYFRLDINVWPGATCADPIDLLGVVPEHATPIPDGISIERQND